MARCPVVLLAATALVSAQVSKAATPNPCSLLTNTQVAKAIGGAVVSRTPMSSQYFPSCKWTGPDLAPPGVFPAQRTVMLQVLPTTKAQFEKTAQQQPNARRVNGVGELAFVIPQGEGGFFNAYAHGYMIELEVSLVTSGIPIEKTLAKDAMARL